MIVVAPLIEPLIDKEPLEVVTVQSPVCAEGFDNTELMTTKSLVMFAFAIVCGKDEKDVDVITIHPPISKDSMMLSSELLFASEIALTFVLGYNASVFAESSNKVVTFAIFTSTTE